MRRTIDIDEAYDNLQLLNAPLGMLAGGKVSQAYNAYAQTHTQQGCERDEPGANVEQSFDSLLLLECLVSDTALVIPNALERSDPLLFSEHAGMHRRVWQPDDDTDSDKDGKAAQQEIDDLVRCQKMSVVE